MNPADEKFMNRAIELAQLGLGSVSPNPLVGCVIVHEGKIIGEGYHKKYGEAHAEVNAINAVTKNELLKESTAYVTLEPCSHTGKTPPCADLLIKKGIKKVVVAHKDPFKEVDGNGLQKLHNANIQTEVGVLEDVAKEQNRRFLTFINNKRPYVILKWAQTADGFIARENYDSKWISNEKSRQLVHKWRTEEDAIIVGKNTAKYDNPLLTARDWKGKNPVRILLDRKLEIDHESNLYNADAKTIILNEKKETTDSHIIWTKISDFSPSSILEKIYSLNIQSVIIEGGAKVLNSFVNENCWDEARVFISSAKFEKGIAAPDLKTEPIKEEEILDDILKTYRNKWPKT